MSWLGNWFRRKAERPKHEYPQQTIPCKVVGIYATIHTSLGDFASLPPSEVTFDCELITLVLPVDLPDELIKLTSSTIHFGVTNVEMPINPPMLAGRGERVSVVHTITMASLENKGGPVPEWAR